LLFRTLLATIRDAERAVIDDARYVAALGLPGGSYRAEDVWCSLLERAPDTPRQWWRPIVDTIAREGPLARRILRAVGSKPDRARLHEVYGRLCECLRDGRMLA
jgi:hypothetical protein